MITIHARRRIYIASALAVSALLVTLLNIPTNAKTFSFPHVLEKSGTINNTQFTFDSTLVLTYNGSLNGKDKGTAHVDLYLYDDQTSQPLVGSNGLAICAPCGYDLNSQQRKLSIRIDDLITSRGGGFDSDLKTSFAVLLTSGSASNAVNCQLLTVNSHTNANDLSVFGFDPVPINAAPSILPPGTPQPRRVFVLPHVLEKSGTINNTQFTFDTTIFATYTGGLPGTPAGTDATVDLYLYDDSGQPMLGNGGTSVCAPCSFDLGTGGSSANARKRTIVIDDLINAAGGFDTAVKLGFGILVVGGTDPDRVALQGFVVNSHTSPFDLSVLSVSPQPVKTNSGATTRKTFVLPHILEKSGLTATDTFTFDTTLFATYTAGLGGTPPGPGASMDLYLYEDSGQLLTGLNGTPVCAPCTLPVNAQQRKQSIRIDDLITSHGGGFDTAVKLGFGIIVVSGGDPDGVNLQGFVVNSHTSPFDLSVFGFEPQEISAARISSAPDSSPPATKAFVLPHVLEKSGTINTTQFTFDTTLYATYAGGLPGTVSSNGAAMKLYLYDAATSLPLSGNNGDVCNPCTYGLTVANPKASLILEDVILSHGGSLGKSVSGLAVLDGDYSNVKLQGFVVNSHTSPFDLSVFGFDPQPLEAARNVPLPVVIIQPTVLLMQLAIPTVIGVHYTVEGKTQLTNPDWSSLNTFDGDGSIKTISIDTAASSQQFVRVKGN